MVTDTRSGTKLGEGSVLADTVLGTVDSFDAAAHLEAMGFGERAARSHGYGSTFEHADSLVRSQLAGSALTSRRQMRHDGGLPSVSVRGALARSTVMLAGVVICLGTVPNGATGADVFAAGACGWLAGQAVSAGIWNGLSAGKRPTACVNGCVMTLMGLGLTALMSAALGSFLPLQWALWSCAVAVLLILGPLRQVTAAVTVAGCLAGVLGVLLPAGQDRPLSSVLVLAAAGVAAVLLTRGLPDRRAVTAGIRGSARPAVLLALGQAAAQLVMLALLMREVGPARVMPLAVAGLAASAVAEPALDAALGWCRRLAAQPDSWRSLRTRTALLGVASVLGTSLAGLLIAVALTAHRGLHAGGLTFAAAVFALCAVSAGAGLQLRTGSAVGATGLAVVALILTAAALALPEPAAALTTAVLVTAITCALSARSAAQPTNW